MFVSLLVLTGSCSLYLLDVCGISILVCSCLVEVPFVGASCVLDFARNIVVDISVVLFFHNFHYEVKSSWSRCLSATSLPIIVA